MFLVFFIIGLIGPIAHITLSHKEVTPLRLVDLYIMYFLFGVIGLGSIYVFIGHAFFGEQIARFIGWPPGNPFQLEVAFANLAFGVLGFLSIWFRGDFWIATIIGQTIFSWGAAYGHIKDMIEHNNYAPGNVGLVLYLDILIPLILVILLLISMFLKRAKKNK